MSKRPIINAIDLCKFAIYVFAVVITLLVASLLLCLSARADVTITQQESEWWHFFFGFLGLGGLLMLCAILKRR